MSDQRIERTTTEEDAGERFDRWVARVAGISRQRAMKLFDDGHVRVGRRRAKKGELVEAGLSVVIEPPQSESPVPQPDAPLTVLHEDEWLLAVDKPAGMPMHPLRSGELDTLANAVLARFPDVVGASPEERCPGLVHRLDRDTSGVVLWARRQDVWDSLRAQLSARTMTKRYLALVEGIVEGEGEIPVPLAHDPKNASRMIATPYPAEAEEMKAREALTLYRALATGEVSGEPYTLLEVHIVTGVMHQIRAHFSFAGHPVAGDALYGGRPMPGHDGSERSGTERPGIERPGIERHWLHAESIGFVHPNGEAPLTIHAPVPPELQQVLDAAGIALG